MKRNLEHRFIDLKRIGKRTVVTCAGVVAACSLALGSLVDSPAELFTGTETEQAAVLSADEKNALGAASSRRVRLGDRLRSFFFAQPSIVRGLALLPFWAVGKAILALVSLLFTALNPALQAVLGVLLNAALLFGLFSLLLKLLFPNVPLKKLLTKRNVLLLAGGSLLLAATDAILRAFWADYRPISIAVKLAAGLVVLALLCWRIFGKRMRTRAAAV